MEVGRKDNVKSKLLKMETNFGMSIKSKILFTSVLAIVTPF